MIELIQRGLRAMRFAYDAVEQAGKRKAHPSILRSEDLELSKAQRAKLVGGARDLPRNFTIAAWMVRKHLDYVSTFKFQCRTASRRWTTGIEYLVKWWIKPWNCDVAARHPLPRPGSPA